MDKKFLLRKISRRERVAASIFFGLVLLKPIIAVLQGELWPIKAWFIYKVVAFFIEVVAEFFRKAEDFHG